MDTTADAHAAAAEVDVVPAQRDGLADSQARLREEREQQPPLGRRRVEQPCELILGQRVRLLLPVVGLRRRRDADARRRVRADKPVLDGGREQRAQRREREPDGVAGEAAAIVTEFSLRRELRGRPRRGPDLRASQR